MTKEQYLAGLAGWDLSPIEVDGTVVCIVMTRGPELHFVTFGTGWQITRAEIRRRLEPLLERYGRVVTSTPAGSDRQIRFNKILGFEQTGEDEFLVHFELTRQPFSRKNTCQQSQ